MQHFPRVVELLREQGAGDTLVIAGGVIPAEDAQRLREAGVPAIYPLGTSTDDIVAFLRQTAASR
jgi:methylmalonyl-CoA mutase C-terminal domain/subunit